MFKILSTYSCWKKYTKCNIWRVAVCPSYILDARFLEVNLLKPTGYVMHLNIQQLYFCPHCIYVFCIYLRTNSDLCHLQHKLIGIYNRDEKCLQRGTDWVFKWISLRFVFKGLISKPHNMSKELCTVPNAQFMNLWPCDTSKLRCTALLYLPAKTKDGPHSS
jgi:hypothetical protein